MRHTTMNNNHKYDVGITPHRRPEPRLTVRAGSVHVLLAVLGTLLRVLTTLRS